jgi:penicillin-binding protein 1A
LGRSDLAGKTGTTNDHQDAWFTGFNPALVATAWVGFDHRGSLGRKETGGRAALPLWMGFMGVALAGTPELYPERPAELVTRRIDPETGLPAEPDEDGAVLETFSADSAPEEMAAPERSYQDPEELPAGEVSERLF